MQYDHEILLRPDFALLNIKLEKDASLCAEPSAMASMSPNISLKSGLKGGLLKSISRAFGGESLVVNTFKARGEDGELALVPGSMGDVHHYRLQGQRLMLQRGAYLASAPTVNVSGKWEGMRGFFSGEGLVLLQASGEGDLFFSSYGSILEVDVSGGYVVDTGYIVAFEDTLNYQVSVIDGLKRGGTWKSLLFGGEGLVCRFEGQGKLWIQTRNVYPFLNWVYPFRPAKNKN